MKLRVWKYRLKPTMDNDELLTLTMPVGARILSVHEQGSCACLWALVDPTRSGEERRFLVVGTGLPMMPRGGNRFDYVGTVFLDGDSLVLHVFEVLS